MRQSRVNRCLRLSMISGKKENAGQKQSTQKTSGCGRLVSGEHRSVRGGGGGGGKNATKGVYESVHIHTCAFYCSYILKHFPAVRYENDFLN